MSKINVYAKGSFQDTLIWKSISGFTRTEERPWRSNQIQDSALLTIAERLMGASAQSNGNYSAWGSIHTMKLGEGNVSWDAQPPTKPFTQQDLTAAWYNKPVYPNDFQFYDTQQGATTTSVSNAFRLEVTIGYSESNGASLREFGLFSGATSSLESDWNMINWVSHPVIHKDQNLSIERTIDIQFGIDRS